MLELRDGQQVRVTLPDRDERLARTVEDYNRANPSRGVTIRYEQESATLGLIGSVALSLLPLVLLIVLVVMAAYVISRSRAPDRYDQLRRLADLRDRGALTDEEFEREKRRVLS